MTDRLKDLKRGGVSSGDVAIDVHESDALNAREKSILTDFFGDVELVKKNINLIKNVTKRIGEIQQQVILATTNDKESELSAELKPLVEETNKKANIAKQMLQKLREDTERMKTKDGQQSEIRIRENLVSTLTRKFVDVMKEYQSVQTKYKTEIKKKVKRQVQIVKADASSEEIDSILKSGGADQVFKDAILKGEAADSVRNMYMHVADKYQDVLTIEASVAELHQMFIDFALLTEQQGELLDQIEFQVKAASDYIDEGNEEMIKAIEYQKSIRKRQCCIVMGLLVLIGIILLVVMMKT
jgi:t-SNARE complex subunit (syntaxin)|eukprot:GSChrysophyteH1.ASY1.ANO1.2306.1 assembled CDS